jgi:hypothetical protein
MQSNLWNMAQEATKAAAYQQKAAYSVTLADESSSMAAENQREGEALELRGEARVTQGEADEALSATDQRMADEFGVKAGEEQAAAVAEFGEAAGEDILVEQDVAEATAEAALATRDGFQANADEIVVGACEVVPILDIVCDVVGGIAAVGLETAAAKQAAAAAADYAVAVAAQVEEESQLAEAAELQAQGARDGEVAAESQATASELEAKAQEALAEGVEEEAVGEEKLTQSAAEQEAAEQEQAEAVGEEEGAAQSWQKSVVYGVSAWWDAMMAGLVSLVALGFFGVRVLISFGVAALKTLCVPVAPRIKSGGEPVPCFPMRTVSRVFHHVLIFSLVAGLFGNMILVMDQVAIRSRGGILLQFGVSAAILQSLLLHAIPRALLVVPTEQAVWLERVRTGFSMFIRRLLVLWPLFVLEILLLRVNLGSTVFSSAVIAFLQQWCLWGLFALALMVHYIFIERLECKCHGTRSKAERGLGRDGELNGLLHDENAVSDVDTKYGSSSAGDAAGETLVDADIDIEVDNRRGRTNSKDSVVQRSAISEERPFLQLLWKDWQRLKFPFELLVASSMFALLRQSIPNLLSLWPASRAIILAANPHWHLAVLGTGVASILTLAVCLRISARGDSR